MVRYVIQKYTPLPPSMHILDIACLKTPGIGTAVAKTCSGNHEFSSRDIYLVSNTDKFLEYSPDMCFIWHGNGKDIFFHQLGGGNTYIWSNKTVEPSLHTRFSPQGIVVCKLGWILISLWNNEFGDRSIGMVVAWSSQECMLVENFKIYMDKNRPLLTCPTYLKENGNGVICVSDVGAVVVTDAGGMLRFRYQGTSRNSNFEPYVLCCDSVCNVIIADMKDDWIHVIDKDGSFLHYLWYEGINMPRALCIDENDNVYVGEWNTYSIKVISR